MRAKLRASCGPAVFWGKEVAGVWFLQFVTGRGDGSSGELLEQDLCSWRREQVSVGCALKSRGRKGYFPKGMGLYRVLHVSLLRAP